MQDIIFTNARIFRGEEGFWDGGSLRIRDGRILAVHPGPMGGSLSEDGSAGGKDPAAWFPSRRDGDGRRALSEENASGKSLPEAKDGGAGSAPAMRIDLQGLYVLPGLLDLHTHGNSGYDFSDGSLEGLCAMGRYLASHGVTSFAPTSMTLPYDQLEKTFRTAEAYMNDRPRDGARAVGIHMEGPYLSEKKKGAQNGAYLRRPDADGFLALQEGCGHRIKIVDVAPELEGGEAFIRRISPECLVSIAHTDASWDEAAAAFEAGASHLTHLFNGMPPLLHRAPGVIGAAFDRENVTAELICDGLHVHPCMVRMAFRLFSGRICLISDALRCCGMPDGEYELGGQQVFLTNGQARLADGTLAGAAKNLYEDMVNAICFGVKKEEAVLAATLVPARILGLEKEIGSLAAGKRADFIICDSEWRIRQVYVEGVKILPEEDRR